MKFNDQLFIIRNRLFEKKNIILAIVLTLIFLILFTCLTIIKFSLENKKEIRNSEFGRTYLISSSSEEELTSKQIDEIKKIENVELVINNKYQNSKRFEISEFDFKNEKGIILIKPLLKDNDIKVKKGKKILDKYEMACPNIFYPHEYNERIYSNLFYSSKDLINKKLSINSENENLNNKNITITIVGIYENKYFEEANTCYVDTQTFDELTSNYMGYIESYDEKGNLISKQYTEYKDYILRIDDIKNTNNVLNSLEKLNIQYENIININFELLNILLIIPLIISVIIIILTMIILYYFIIKKNNNKINNIGTLKALGYNEKLIIDLNINENIIIIIISYLIALFLYLIIINNITYTLLVEVTYNNFILRIPYIFIILSFFFFNIFIVIIDKSNLKKILNNNIDSLLKNNI